MKLVRNSLNHGLACFIAGLKAEPADSATGNVWNSFKNNTIEYYQFNFSPLLCFFYNGKGYVIV